MTATSAATDLPGKPYPLSSQKSLASHATAENQSGEAAVHPSPSEDKLLPKQQVSP